MRAFRTNIPRGIRSRRLLNFHGVSVGNGPGVAVTVAGGGVYGKTIVNVVGAVALASAIVRCTPPPANATATIPLPPWAPGISANA